MIKSDKYLKFTSSTSGDYDGFILEIEGDENTEIKFSSLAGSASASYKEIVEHGFSKEMGGLNLKLEMEASFSEIPKEQYCEHNKLQGKH